jgi:hypothetical protein
MWQFSFIININQSITTHQVASKTKEIAKQKLGKTETANELGNQLEEKARKATTLQALADLHKDWIQRINRKDGPTYVRF